jgi:hypothetical protein
MSNNYWGPPDEDDHLPEWMRADTYRDGNKPKVRAGKSLNESIMEAMAKPPVPIVPDKEPNA